MLFFVDSNNREYGWHVGSRIPEIDNCVEVQADGDELEYLITRFHNLPTVKNQREIRWKGEFARFIYENFPRPTIHLRR